VQVKTNKECLLILDVHVKCTVAVDNEELMRKKLIMNNEEEGTNADSCK